MSFAALFGGKTCIGSALFGGKTCIISAISGGEGRAKRRIRRGVGEGGFADKSAYYYLYIQKVLYLCISKEVAPQAMKC